MINQYTLGDLRTFVPGGAGIGKGFPSGLNGVRGPTGGRSGELGPTPDDGILDTHCWGWKNTCKWNEL